MTRTRHLLAVALVAGLALAAPASAAYAPQLAVKIDPATPSTPAAISTTVTQQTGETASKTVVVNFPVGFSANLDVKVATCSQSDADAFNCPAASQLGAATATASVVVVPLNLTGGVYYGGVDAKTRIHLIVILNGDPRGPTKIDGFVKINPDGSFTSTFDNLPNVLTTSFTLSLNGGVDKALSLTPDTCGTFTFAGAFTSQNGETAKSSAPVQITGCTPTKLEIVNLALSRTGTAVFNLTAPGPGKVTISKAGRKVVSKSFTGREGVNTVKTRHKLKPGTYVLRVSATSADGQKVSAHRTIHVH